MSLSREPRPFGLFDGVLARGPVREEVGGEAWLRAMLDVEAALAKACARAGLFSMTEADAIARACTVDRFDVDAIARAAAEEGNPVPALVRALTSLVEGPGAAHVHRGATSQDIVDTAAMLVARRALVPLLDDLNGAARAAATLAADNRATLMIGRTLLQPALPITFGLEAAAWLTGLDDAAERLDEVRSRFAVQLGGAAGTLASLGERGTTVLALFAEELDLADPGLPWHTVRNRVMELAAALAEAAGAIGKAARDVTLLSQTELGEVREARTGGGSSTLPQKRNPVAAVSALGCALSAPGLLATISSAMVQEHGRAAGAWHAEWRPFSALLETVGSAAAWLRDSLEHLEVDGARMRANLERAGGQLLAERITTALTAKIGRLSAHDAVIEACRDAARGVPLGDALRARPAIAEHLSGPEIDELLDPAGYLGSALVFVDRALARHAARTKGAT
jgi:3-carboxy-cis,cis-muconate cycloisomerase